MTPKIRTRSPAAFSLVLSLIILTLLSILVIGFISSTAFDRTTAHAFANKTRAELAADTAVNSAMSLITGNIADYPDSATVWESLAPQGGGENVEGTMLYYSDAMPNDPKAQKHLLPLLSTGLDANGLPLGQVPLAQKAEALGTEEWTDDNSIDLNHARFNGDLAGWIGSPPLQATDPQRPRPRRAKWIEVKDQPAAGQTARTVSRYAFWVEDESFKVNLNLLRIFDKGAFDPKNPDNKIHSIEIQTKASDPSDIPLQGLLRNGYPTMAEDDRDSLAKQVFDLRDTFAGKRLPDLRSFNQIDSGRALGDETKFYGTIFSGGLNLSRHGSQRLNLNGLGLNTADSPTRTEMEKQVKQIVETVRFHTQNKNDYGNFGQRFYRKSDNTSPAVINGLHVSKEYQEIYLYKIAANIRDYIDSDLQPTIIQAGGRVAPLQIPIFAFPENEGPDASEIWAQGKDSAPFLDEAAVRYRSEVKEGRYKLRVDYYIEFWNMSNQDVYADMLGPNPFVSVGYQVPWVQSTGGGSDLTADNEPPGGPDRSKERDLKIYIGPNASAPVLAAELNAGGRPPSRIIQPRGVCFKAGACTVVTTDPNFDTAPVNGSPSPAYSGGYNLPNIYYCSNLGGSGKREYEGPVASGIKPVFRSGATTPQDYETEVFMANDRGFLESQAAPLAHGGQPKTTTSSSSRDDWYGGTLYGNTSVVSALCDPRTNNEQLVFTRFSGTFGDNPDQSRYANNENAPRFSLGYPNDAYFAPQGGTGKDYKGTSLTFIPWPDYYRGWNQTTTGEATNPTAANAPAVVANAALTSIGQLGDIFDPARLPRTNNLMAAIEGSRGGGRTLRIGQHDDVLPDYNAQYAPIRQWDSWRLMDFLGISPDMQLPGLININGLRRDNGAAFRAACYGIMLTSLNRGLNDSKPNAAAVPTPKELVLDEARQQGLQKLITQATSGKYDSDGANFCPFMERGELSELDLYSKGTDLIEGVNMAESFDRSREELFRRLAELTTTRGSIFSVYAIGQSITETPGLQSVKKVTGTHQVKVTFQLLPKKAKVDSTGSDDFGGVRDFDPTKPDEVNARFAPPDHYDIRILQIGS